MGYFVPVLMAILYSDVKTIFPIHKGKLVIFMNIIHCDVIFCNLLLLCSKRKKEARFIWMLYMARILFPTTKNL